MGQDRKRPRPEDRGWSRTRLRSTNGVPWGERGGHGVDSSLGDYPVRGRNGEPGRPSTTYCTTRGIPTLPQCEESHGISVRATVRVSSYTSCGPLTPVRFQGPFDLDTLSLLSATTASPTPVGGTCRPVETGVSPVHEVSGSPSVIGVTWVLRLRLGSSHRTTPTPPSLFGLHRTPEPLSSSPRNRGHRWRLRVYPQLSQRVISSPGLVPRT